MGIHLEKFGFSLLTPPKCGSTSLKHLFFKVENGRAFEPFTHNGNSFNIHQLYPSQKFELERKKLVDGVRMCIVRDPLDRIVSCHSNRVLFHKELDNVPLTEEDQEAGMTLRPNLTTFLRHLARYRALSPSIRQHAQPLSVFLGKDASIYDHVFDLSQMDGLLARIQDLVDVPLPEIGRLQRAGQRFKPKQLTERQRRIIKNKFAEDYEIFGEYFPKENVAASDT